MAKASEISDRIVDAILAKKLAPGCRLGEQQLTGLFGCSRTIVREALARLSARGIIKVSARRGWYLIEPSHEDAREAFEARLVIETGLLRNSAPLQASAVQNLRAHLKQQKTALKGGDSGLRSLLLGDFHVCLARCLGNKLLADTIRDLSVRTSLVAIHYQSGDQAEKSFHEHEGIVSALETRDMRLAERLMTEHLGTWDTKLRVPAKDDPLSQLRRALAPIGTVAQDLHTSRGKSDGKRRRVRPA
jgi:DNA-binding GntR family transcriptional regulator